MPQQMPSKGLAAMRKGSVFIDHTTTSAQVAHELHTIASDGGFGFVDAPVSGGQSGAENGVLTVMCGGDAQDVGKAEGAIASYARLCRHLGPTGSGQLAKMVNQLCIAGVVQGLAEGVHFAQRAGLPVEAVMEVLGKGAAGSWQMENRASTMQAGRYEFGFAVDWMRKDLGICLAEGARNGARLPLAALVDEFYAEVQAMDGGRWDTSSLLARLNRESASWIDG
jgi:3-hydroxyisobutyrate dehydrogenase-like beta-hydroxyacid dehydrogenase